MVGWVILSNTWVELTEAMLRARLDRVYPGEFLPPRERGTFVVEGPVAGMQFMVNSAIAGAAGMFMLHSVPGPYTEFSAFANHIGDAALRRVAVAQQAWLGLERIGGEKDDEAYRFVGKVLAELAPPDAAAFVHPGRLTTLSFDDKVRRRLANGSRFD